MDRHAIKNGMTMGIVNAGAMPIYEDIPQPMRDYIELPPPPPDLATGETVHKSATESPSNRSSN